MSWRIDRNGHKDLLYAGLTENQLQKNWIPVVSLFRHRSPLPSRLREIIADGGDAVRLISGRDGIEFGI